MTKKSTSVSTSLQHPWFGNGNDTKSMQQAMAQVNIRNP